MIWLLKPYLILYYISFNRKIKKSTSLTKNISIVFFVIIYHNFPPDLNCKKKLLTNYDLFEINYDIPVTEEKVINYC